MYMVKLNLAMLFVPPPSQDGYTAKRNMFRIIGIPFNLFQCGSSNIEKVFGQTSPKVYLHLKMCHFYEMAGIDSGITILNQPPSYGKPMPFCKASGRQASL